jgi:3-methyl-2-oxobutanoate hydroxymethyltransferase
LVQTVSGFERAGAIALVLETVPTEVTKIIYERIRIPLLGTGVGPYNDSPMINMYDLLGYSERIPRFAKKYADIRTIAIAAGKEFVNEVIQGKYPGPQHSYSMKEGEYEKLITMLNLPA